jgi:hypothetical protein
MVSVKADFLIGSITNYGTLEVRASDFVKQGRRFKPALP